MKFLIPVLFLVGCATFAEKPNNTTAFTSDQIVALAKQVELAQSMGVLGEEKGDEYLSWLKRANDMLGDSSVLYSDIEACEDSTTRFQCIDAVMAKVQGAIQ